VQDIGVSPSKWYGDEYKSLPAIPAQIQFSIENEAAAERFVREYLLEAVDRASEIEGCAGITFGLNEPPNPDGGAIGVGVLGEADPFIEQEKSLWEQYRDGGFLTDWEVSSLEDGVF